MIRFSCPKCDTSLKTPDEKAGTKLLCPECGERVDVPSDSSEKQSGGSTKTATLPKKTSPKTASAGSSKGLFIGLAVGACVLVAGGAAAAIWAMKNKDDKPTQTASNTQAPAPQFPAPVTQAPAPEVTPTTPPVTQAPVPAVTPAPVADSKPSAAPPGGTQVASNAPVSSAPKDSFDLSSPEAKEIRNYLLGVTCWVVTYYPDKGMAYGTGSVVDRENKLILTNHHVVASHLKERGRPIVFFPIYEKGKEVMEKEYYEKLVHRNEGISWHVVWHDSRRDLALIKVVEIPEGVKAIKIAPKSVEPGDRVHSLGNAGASGALWVYTHGQVRAVYHKDWVSGSPPDLTRRSCQIVETTSPTNSGDSGGPMVNDRKELVAVTQGGVVGGGAQLISIFVDISEVRAALKSYYESNKIKPPINLDEAPVDTSRIGTLVKVLEDSDARKRANAALSLGRHGTDAKAAIDPLLKAAKDKDENVKKTALEALEQIGGMTQRHLPQVIECLKDGNPEVRTAAVSIIRLMGGEAEAAAEPLTNVLKTDKDPIVRRRAAAALGAIGASAKSAIPNLGAALKDESAAVRSEAAGALAKFGASSVGVLNQLADALQDNQQDVRINSLRALEAIGPEAKSVVPKLHKALQERDKDTRLAAVAAVAAIKAEDKDTVKLLVDLLEDKDYRTPVNDALVRIGKGTVPVLNLELNNPKAEVRLGVVLALEQLGADAAPALQRLGLLAQRDLNAEVRAAAVKAVTTIQKKVRGQ